MNKKQLNAFYQWIFIMTEESINSHHVDNETKRMLAKLSCIIREPELKALSKTTPKNK